MPGSPVTHACSIPDTPSAAAGKLSDNGIDASIVVQCRSDEAETEAFTHALARQPALRQAFITLDGNLGAGKTTLVRHLLRALGVVGRIKSPTYAVVEPYALACCDAWHFDFYRFNDPREWEDAGFRDLFAAPGLKLCEWPEKAAGMLPVPDLSLHLDPVDDTRRHVRLDAFTPHLLLVDYRLRDHRSHHRAPPGSSAAADHVRLLT